MLLPNGSTARLVPADCSDLWQEAVISHLINGFSIIISRNVPAYIIIKSEGENATQTKPENKHKGAEFGSMLYLLLNYYFSSLF